jgi:hypothetical protein
MKSILSFSCFPFQRVSTSLIVLLALLVGLGQPALAGTIYNTYKSWSYYTDRDNNSTYDDHWTEESSWQGSSSVVYDGDNYAKSWVGFDGGSLGAKIGVSVNNDIYKVYSSSYYREDGFNCEDGNCGTTVPLGGSFEMRLQQDGSFTLGSSNFSLMYSLRTPSTAYTFHFAVEQGEGPLRPYGWFSKENASGFQETNMGIDPAFFKLIWEDDNEDGVYNFSYDFSFTGTTNVDLEEELSVSAWAYAADIGNQFFDSYNSFRANVTPDEGASFYRGGQLIENPGSQVVPEPAAIFLFGLGLLGVAGVSRRKK